MTSAFRSDHSGANLRTLLLEPANLPEIADELQLLQAVCDKVGPFASKEKLLWHLRASRGKVHWAVNSYLRAVLATTPRPSQEDFDPKLQGRHQLQQHQSVPATSQHKQQQKWQDAATEGSAAAAAAGGVAAPQSSHTTPSTCGRVHGPATTASSSNACGPNMGSGGDGVTPPAVAAVQLDGLPGNVLELMLSHLDLASLLSAACSCQALYRASQAEGLWRQLFAARWGAVMFPINTSGSSSSRTHQVVTPAAAAAAAASGGAAAASEGEAVGVAEQGIEAGAASSNAACTAAAAAAAAAAGHRPVRAPVPLFSAAAPPDASVPLAEEVPLVPPAGAAAAAAGGERVDLTGTGLAQDSVGSPPFVDTAAGAVSAASDCQRQVLPAVGPLHTGQHQQLQQPHPHQQQQQQQQQAHQQLPPHQLQQQQRQQQHEDCVSRWTGSSCASLHQPPPEQLSHDMAPPSAARGATSTAGPPPAAGSAVTDATAGSSTRSVSASSSGSSSAPTPVQLTRQQGIQQQPVPPQGMAGCTHPPTEPCLPAVAPAGSWCRQFKQQYFYQVCRACPKCGAQAIVPIVYGFPSAALLQGMAVKRLVLGGDHLIESCHVWACGGCRSCFRFFPYVNVQLWLQDDAQQQRQDQCRVAAAGRGSGRQAGVHGTVAAGAHGAAAGVGVVQGDQGVAGGVQQGGPGEAEGFPRYTYEL